jgi:hypothetical protein
MSKKWTKEDGRILERLVLKYSPRTVSKRALAARVASAPRVGRPVGRPAGYKYNPAMIWAIVEHYRNKTRLRRLDDVFKKVSYLLEKYTLKKIAQGSVKRMYYLARIKLKTKNSHIGFQEVCSSFLVEFEKISYDGMDIVPLLASVKGVEFQTTGLVNGGRLRAFVAIAGAAGAAAGTGTASAVGASTAAFDPDRDISSTSAFGQ